MVQIMMDGPPRPFPSVLGAVVRRLAGTVFLTLAIVAGAPLTLAFFAVIVWVSFGVLAGPLDDPPTHEFHAPFSLSSPIDGLGVSVNEVLVKAGAVAGVSAWAGFLIVRGNRRTVLFLRRFGDHEATRAITFATRRIGRSWRLVTCDDAELVPVGVAPALAATIRFADRTPQVLRSIWKTAVKWYRLVMFMAGAGALGILAVVVFGHEPDSGSPAGTRLSESAEPIAVVFRMLVWVFLIGGGLYIARLVLVYLILPFLALASIALAPLTALISMASDSARSANEIRQLTIRNGQDIEQVVPMVKRLFRGIFSPKLLVLTVAHAVWRPTVSKLIALSSTTLVDVSVPTASLLWEITELNRRPGAPVVFIAHRDSADQLTKRDALGEPASIAEEMLALLRDQQVLLYTTDRQGLRRFARALHASLEATS